MSVLHVCATAGCEACACVQGVEFNCAALTSCWQVKVVHHAEKSSHDCNVAGAVL